MTSIIEDVIVPSQCTFIAGVICNIINACNYLHFIKTSEKNVCFYDNLSIFKTKVNVTRLNKF